MAQEPISNVAISSRPSPHRFEAIDSLRGFAALSVALHHLQVGSHIYFWHYVRNSFLFVEFFFVLSGFVIACAYQDKIHNQQDFKIFAIKRIARVWPLHLVMLAAFLCAETTLYILSHKIALPLARPPFSENRTLSGVPANFFLLNGFLPIPGSEWNGPSWSISVELVSYVLFALILLLAKRHVRLCQFAAIALGLAWLIHADGEPGFYAFLPRCIYSFFIGVALWNYRGTFSGIPATPFQIVAIAAAFAMLTFGAGYGLFMVGPIVFLFVIAAVSFEDGAVAKLLKKPFCLFLGRTSYSIYMVHFFIAFVVANVLKVVAKLLHSPAVVPGTELATIKQSPFIMDGVTVLYLVVIVTVARYAYRLVERPGMELGARLASRVRRPSREVVVV
ncbi:MULTISPECIES: acyltransferase [unclassified Novosphingobium]|uniref:acyltransferase family protein n=1 Tax=unclassified Novosphingobium TaxID=2644732 RepID=UPI001494A034|nr:MULTISPECIES: acyltransferase [unclassified Novosphingobium]MBB3358162.1 hypothetical protein [Novosphingobium sp. BK256]MBB3374523.1 hypothetical protein [Novosphingobium sp. BK280]MBB3378935.1 hypothetical protein [Novosphingobium sp. BK258]MBB3420629.1 hypothetical protein [Novosphingobium sp. BK267]MBB3448249.1 hypothetical protein [Novosphingobium sp. BK352]